MSDRGRLLPRPLLRAVAGLAAAALVGLLAPAGAGAASYIIRPASSNGLGWTAVPAGTPAKDILARAVSQPAAPDKGSYLTASGPSCFFFMCGTTSSSDFPAPTLAAGETPASLTAWAYVSTGASQSLSLRLSSDHTQLGSTQVPAAAPAGWHSVTTSGAPAVAALTGLSLDVSYPGQSAAAGTALYVAYLDLETNGPTPATPTATPVPAPPLPVAPAPSASRAPAPVAVPDARVPYSPLDNSAGVELSCAATVVGECRGELLLTLPPASTGHRAPARHRARMRAVLARCGRGCRVLGHAPLRLEAGARRRIKVHMAVSRRTLFGGRRSVTLLATTTIQGANGKPVTTTRLVTLVQPSAPTVRRVARRAPHSPAGAVGGPTKILQGSGIALTGVGPGSAGQSAAAGRAAAAALTRSKLRLPPGA